MSPPPASPEHPAREEPGRVIELGWLLLNRLEPHTLDGVMRARDRLLERLGREFPEFTWRMPVVQRSAPVLQYHVEPVRVLQEGINERQARHWDFAFVVCRTDLRTYYKPSALAVSSRAVNVAVLSTSRLDQEEEPRQGPAENDPDRLAHRICALVLHLLGDLNGLAHRPEPTACMYPPSGPGDLDQMEEFSEPEQRQLGRQLAAVADTRVEERPGAARESTLSFYLKAVWQGYPDVFRSVLQAKPWEFPYRLSRLTTAAVSALLILLITAEAWDLGMSQPPLLVAGLSLAAWLGTSAFILLRQKLLLWHGRRLTEQVVFTNVSVTIVALLGMATTYLLLFGLALLLGQVLFSRRLVAEWAASLQSQVHFSHHLILAGFVASLGILIGALGASFENNLYFRHITFVDEET